jgi:uncharacterized membrane protein
MAEARAAKNVEAIARLEREAAGGMTAGERLSVAVTNTIGTGWCAFAHVTAFAVWIAWNTRVAPAHLQFDPYPFGLLTMWVSMEGVVLAILVLITQNRMSRQTDRRDHLDLQIDLLAEQEMTLLLRALTRIEERLGIQKPGDEHDEVSQLMQPTDLNQLVSEMDRKIK